MNAFGVERSSIIPSASTELLLPSAKRRRALSETSGLRLPRLEYPDHLNAPILILSLLLSMVIAIFGEVKGTCREGREAREIATSQA